MVRKNNNFQHVNALIALSNKQLMGVVYYFLTGLGVGTIQTARTSRDALRQIEANEFGLVFVDYDFSDIGGPDLTRFIRTCANKTAYAKIFMVIEAPNREKVYAARDAGTHDILGLPLTTGLLRSRLDYLMQCPKPFVETQAYTGPCRRLDRPAVYSGDERRATQDGSRRGLKAVGY